MAIFVICFVIFVAVNVVERIIADNDTYSYPQDLSQFPMDVIEEERSR